jgi:UMF1 family MFS transporter
VETARPAPAINDKSEIFGWMMYDWANSAFSTTVAGALLSPYITSLAQASVGDNGVVLGLGFLGSITAKSFFPICISISVFLQVFLLPVLGAIADYSHLKKFLMGVFCYLGVAATCLMVSVTNGWYLFGGFLFILANLSFGASVVLYNAFLPEICTPDQGDRVSSHGYALGYLGGGIVLALNLVLVSNAGSFGIDVPLAVRLSLLSAGVWWGLFSVVTFLRLRTRAPARKLPSGKNYVSAGFTELGATFRELARLPLTLKYLVGYLFFNDGIQTVLGVASVFLSQELFTAQERAAGTDQAFVLKIYLAVQFVAFFGAVLFERGAAWFGTKRALLTSLVVWAGVVVYAYGFLHSTLGAWGMAAVIALVLGGSQALSRSLFARMIPAGFEASFFGIYEVSERGTSWIGPMLFGIVVGRTGSYRQAILSLIVLFLVGIIVLALTDTDLAIERAGDGGS